MRHALYCCLCAALTFLLIAGGFRYVIDFWLFSFFYSFQTHIGVAVMAGSAVALLLKRSLFPVVLFVAAGAMTGHSLVMRQEFLADISQPVPADAQKIRLLSLNILDSNLEGATAVADTILASGADVVYLLEARPLQTQFGRLASTYPHRIGCGIATDTCDLVILSRHPFGARSYRSLSDLRRDRFALVDIDFGGRKIHFAAIHLSKPYFDDYHTFELIIAGSIIRKLTGDVVIGGDFNSASMAPDMQRFFRRFNMRTGDQEPATWPVAAGPFGIAIDHIYATPGILIETLRAVDSNGSNHFGLVADMALMPRP